MFVKYYAPKSFFVRCFLQLDKSVQHKLHKFMKKKFISGKLFLKQFEMVLEHLTLVTFDPVTPRSIGFICYPEWMCGSSLKKVGQGVLELLIGNEIGYRRTDRPDRPTCAKQYSFSSSKWGKINPRPTSGYVNCIKCSI